MKPELKVIDHPDKDINIHQQIINFGWGKVTIETPDKLCTIAQSVYILELAKLELMRPK